MRITLRAEVHPTEEPERVRRAILNIFPDAVARETGETLVMAAESLQTVSTRIRELQIRDTARAILLRSVRDNGIRFQLNKQAAYGGRVNFTDGSAVLGDIEVIIETNEPEAIARMIAEG